MGYENGLGDRLADANMTVPRAAPGPAHTRAKRQHTMHACGRIQPAAAITSRILFLLQLRIIQLALINPVRTRDAIY
jgi:hypothetical protein